MPNGDPRLYVYALVERGLPDRVRAAGRQLHLVSIDDVGVVVGRHRQLPSPTIEALSAQLAVVEALAARTSALLPARFGTTIERAELIQVITKHRQQIAAGLALVRGRCQMTVRVFGAPASDRPGENRQTGGTAFLESVRARARHVPPEVHVIRTALAELTAAERISPGAAGLRVSLLHLVDAGDVDAYRARAAALPALLAPLTVKVTGPSPAFGFVPDLF